MSADATAWTFRHSPYSGAALAVHLAVADSVNDQNGNEFWMAQEKLAAKARVSRQTANAAMERLVADGLVTLLDHKRRGRSNLYRFEFPDLAVVYDGRHRPPELSTEATTPPDELSSQATTVVKPGDNELSTEATLTQVVTQEEPSTSAHEPVDNQPDGGADLGWTTTTTEQTFNHAVGILARRALTARETERGPVADSSAWLTATGRNLRAQHVERARVAFDTGELDPSIAADALAAWLVPPAPPPASRPPTDPLASTQQAHNAIAERNARRAAGQACPRCDDVGLCEQDDGTYANCPECAA